MFFESWYGLLRVLIISPLAYLSLVMMLRVSGKRTLAKMNAFDLTVTVAMGSMLATAILSRSVHLLEAVIGMGMLILLQMIITWLYVRSSRIRGWVKAEPSLLYHRGTYLDAQLRRMRVTRSEIEAAVRKYGCLSMDDISAVVLETDGTFSVMPYGTANRDRPVGVAPADVD
jgi:uncharacterized membrane protein YcaP (DUF421 family)